MLQGSKEVRVRFAPSPTGYLHVGGARTALFNYLFAKKNNGKLILRIEDTDQARSTEESVRIIINDLLWLGIKWDEGPNPQTLLDEGSLGSYFQSKRLSIYAEFAQQLLKEGKAYYCFLTDVEIDAQKEGHSHMQSPYEDWSIEQALEHQKKTGTKPVVRFKTKNLKKDYTFKDLIRGEITFPSDMVGDFVLLRSDGMPVYNFCCVIDDYLMKITHVLRAEEHLPNTLRQLMIYEALGFQIPEFAHMSLILNEDRQKLSKRHGAVSCAEFRNAGYLPESLNNFMALLGWSSPDGKEIVSMKEMESQFLIERLNPSGAVFDIKKFKWMNSVYLRALDDRALWDAIYPFLNAAELELPSDSEWQVRSVQLFKTSMEVLKDAVELYRPISDKHFVISEEAGEVFTWGEVTAVVLKSWKAHLEAFIGDYLREEDFLSIQDKIKIQNNVKGKHLFMPIRVAVIGKPHGSELKTLVPLLKKSSLITRVDKVLEICK